MELYNRNVKQHNQKKAQSIGRALQECSKINRFWWNVRVKGKTKWEHQFNMHSSILHKCTAIYVETTAHHDLNAINIENNKELRANYFEEFISKIIKIYILYM